MQPSAPPPPYDFTDSSTPTSEKGGPPPAPSHPPPPHEQSSSSAPSGELSFHVYKAGGVFSKDDVITGDDKQAVLYYLEFPLQFMSGWDMTLHRGGKDGPSIIRIQKGLMSSDMSLTMLNGGWTSPFVRTGIFSGTHEFVAFDGKTRYSWKRDGNFSSNWRCENTINKDVIATWRRSVFSVSKDGQLIVSGRYAAEVELILATCLAIEEWARAQRNRNR